MGDFRKRVLSGIVWPVFLLGIILGGFVPLAAGQSTYTVTGLGTLLGSSSAKVAGINNFGQIAGTSADHAFLWSNGVMTDLGTLGGNSSLAHGINDQGAVVGEASTANGEIHAFLWANGAMTDLGTPGETSAAHGINSQGVIVGVASAKNVRGGAVLWSSGQKQFIGDLGPSGSGSTAISINDGGQVAGVSSGFASNQGVVRAVVWLNGAIIDLGSLGGLHSTANSINYQGVVVGWAEIADGSTAAFQWQNGTMRQLPSLKGATTSPGTGTQAASVNDPGQVVGSSLSSNGEMHAVIWTNGRIADLNSLIPKGTGLTLTRAADINKTGQIVVEQQTAPDGAARAFLLTPRHN